MVGCSIVHSAYTNMNGCDAANTSQIPCSVTYSLHRPLRHAWTQSLLLPLPLLMSRLSMFACVCMVSVIDFCECSLPSHLLCQQRCDIQQLYHAQRDTAVVDTTVFFLLPLSHRQHPEFNQILCCISSQIQMLHAIKQAQNGSQRRKSNTPFHRNNWLAQYFIGVVITSSCTLTDTSCLLMKSASSGKPLPSQIVFGSGGKGILKYDYF